MKTSSNNLVKQVGSHLNTQDKTVIYSEISNLISPERYMHSVSDIIGGLTQNSCIGGFGHNINYWNDSTKLPKEAFAHFFEATARNDTEKLAVIQALFPNSYQLFLSYL